MADFNTAVSALFQLEGWHMDDPDDPGGDTYFGIAKEFWPQHYDMWGGPPSLEQAHMFYKAMYWDPLLLDRVTSQDIAVELLEQAVHFGKRRAVRHLQSCVNLALQDNVLVEDGRLGLVTLRTIEGLRYDDTARVLKLMNALQTIWYLFRSDQLDRWLTLIDDETNPDPRMAKFFRGWLNRVQGETT